MIHVAVFEERIKEKLTPDMLATLRDTRYELDWKSLLGVASTKEETNLVSLKIPSKDIFDPLKADLMKVIPTFEQRSIEILRLTKNKNLFMERITNHF